MVTNEILSQSKYPLDCRLIIHHVISMGSIDEEKFLSMLHE